MKMIKLIKRKFRLREIREGFKYIILNCFINKIPCWGIRKSLYKAFGMKIGKGSRIAIKTIVDTPQNIVIGKRSIVNEFCFLDGRGGLKIGNDVSISIYTIILSATHDSASNDFKFIDGIVEIQDNVWTGARAIILDNSIVKKRSVIGAGAVFKGNSEEDSIYIGNPATFLRRRMLKEDYAINYKPFFR